MLISGIHRLGIQSQTGQIVGLGDGVAALGRNHLDTLAVALNKQNNVLVLIQSHSALGATHQFNSGDRVGRGHIKLQCQIMPFLLGRIAAEDRTPSYPAE